MAPPAVVFPFSYAPERLLRGGPTGRPATADRTEVDRHIVVKRLVLNAVSHHEANLPVGPGERIQWRGARRSARRRATGRGWYGPSHLVWSLRILAKSDPATVRRHGALLYERVGAAIDQIDLGARLAGRRVRIRPRRRAVERSRLGWRRGVRGCWQIGEPRGCGLEDDDMMYGYMRPI